MKELVAYRQGALRAAPDVRRQIGCERKAPVMADTIKYAPDIPLSFLANLMPDYLPRAPECRMSSIEPSPKWWLEGHRRVLIHGRYPIMSSVTALWGPRGLAGERPSPCPLLAKPQSQAGNLHCKSTLSMMLSYVASLITACGHLSHCYF